MNTNELTKIEELQIENSKLNERLNNCARQFKKMMQTIDELQQKVSELEAKVNQTSTKQEKSDSKPSNPSNLTSTKEEEEKPTVASEIASKRFVAMESTPNEMVFFEKAEDLADFVQSQNEDEEDASIEDTTTVQDKSDSKPSNDSTLTTTHQEEEKPIEAQQTPLNEKKLRYLDTATNKQYATEEEAQKDGVNPWFLYDWKVGRCITKYTSPSSHSNASTLTHLSINDEKCLRFAFKQP